MPHRSSNLSGHRDGFLVEVEVEFVLGKAVHGVTVNVADVLSIGTPPEDVTTVIVS